MNNSIICPAPLLNVPHGSWDTAGTVYYVQPPLTCALPCPQIVYTNDEWDSLKNLLFVGSILASIMSLVVLLAHIYARDTKYQFVRVMFIAGFLLNSCIVLLFSALNLDKDFIVCGSQNHSAVFYSKANMCVFQGAATIAAFSWIEYWSVILAFDSYLMVRRRARNVGGSANEREETKKRHRHYLIGAFAWSAFLTFPPLIANNYGFDPRQNVPLCLFMFSTDSNYFWGCFIIPMGIMVTLCTMFSVLGICQMQNIFVNSSLYGSDDIRARTGRASTSKSNSTLSARDPLAPGYRASSNGDLTGNYEDDHYSGQAADSAIYSDSMEQAGGLLFSKQRRVSRGKLLHIQEGGGMNDDDRESSLGTLSAPLVSSGHISEADTAGMSMGSEGTRYSDARLQALLGGALALEPDEEERESLSLDMSGGDVRDSYNAPPLPLTHNPLSGGTRFSLSQRGVGVLESRVSESTASDPASSSSVSSSRGDRNSVPSGLVDNSIYRSVATFWTRPASKGRDTGVSDLTSEHLSGSYRGADAGLLDEEEDGEGDYDVSESTKETISLSSGQTGRDTRTSSIASVSKGGVEKKRAGMLRRVGLNSAITQTLRYNGRGLLFVFVYCLSTLYIVPVLYILQRVTYNACQDSANDFVECLLEASYASIELGITQTIFDVDAYVLSVCGDVPQVRPNIGLVYSGLVWLSGYGIIPAVIFGLGSRIMDDHCCQGRKGLSASFGSGNSSDLQATSEGREVKGGDE